MYAMQLIIITRERRSSGRFGHFEYFPRVGLVVLDGLFVNRIERCRIAGLLRGTECPYLIGPILTIGRFLRQDGIEIVHRVGTRHLHTVQMGKFTYEFHLGIVDVQGNFSRYVLERDKTIVVVFHLSFEAEMAVLHPDSIQHHVFSAGRLGTQINVLIGNAGQIAVDHKLVAVARHDAQRGSKGEQ